MCYDEPLPSALSTPLHRHSTTTALPLLTTALHWVASSCWHHSLPPLLCALDASLLG